MNEKNVCNSISTSGAGGTLETRVQAMFVTLMLSNGFAPCLPCCPIKKIKLQGKVDGYETDDLIVFVEDPTSKEERKLLCQVKRSIKIIKSDSNFENVIQSAWKDFNNPRVFNKEKDEIALISEQLGMTDFHCLQWILDQARHVSNYDEFKSHLEKERFSSRDNKKKLKVISDNIKKVDRKKDITDNNIYLFLKHFHLIGVDLEKEGIILSLLHSHISQFYIRLTPDCLLEKNLKIISDKNRNAATIAIENLPKDIREQFKNRKTPIEIPEILKNRSDENAQINWNTYEDASLLSLLNLVGGWYDKSEGDLKIIDKLTRISRDSWFEKTKKMHQLTGSPITHKNGEWRIKDRVELLNSLGGKIYDQELDAFKNIALLVLYDYFLLRTDIPGGAVITREKSAYSYELRMSIAESLSFIKYNSPKFTNCSKDYVVNTIDEIVGQLLSNINWDAYESYCSLLQFLAEASPDKFLGAVERDLKKSPCPFNTVFTEIPFLISYLLSGLELLAWDKEYLVRVCSILGQLSSIEFPKAASALPQKYAHRKGFEGVGEKGGCLKKNALKHMYVSEYEHGSNKRVR